MSEQADRIRLIEELAANAVPPAVSQELDGWRLRANAGFTRRANSVLAVRAGSWYDLATKLDLAEQFYAQRGLPARFQLCPASEPDGLDAALAARGYQIDPALTDVEAAPLAPLAAAAQGITQIATAPSSAWLAAYWQSEAISSAAKQVAQEQMLARIGPPAGFAKIEADGQIIALALGVVERGWLGIFSVATLPAWRGRGLATRLLADLARWAAERDATQSYLQVMQQNLPAQALYRRLGFQRSYHYWYRVREL